MIEAVASLKTLGLVLIVFGLAPGLILRFITLCFRRDDPRRAEMRAELHAVPRLWRPIWVAEQIEVAIFEGFAERFVLVLTGRVIHRWSLASGLERNRLYPDTFWVPTREDKSRIQVGSIVKLMFEMKDGWAERMWVEVTEINRKGYVGTLCNTPVGIPRLAPGKPVKFSADGIIDIDEKSTLDCCKIIDGETA